LALLKRLVPRRPGWPRHIPATLLLLALVFLTVSLARPTADVRVPRDRATIMVVIDVSLSMNSTDWLRAILSYNNSLNYARQVYSFAQHYARDAQAVT
jgi:hypothetical protein